MKLEERRKDVFYCANCKWCYYRFPEDSVKHWDLMKVSCPSGKYYGWETHYAPGRLTVAKGVLKKFIKPDKKVVDIIFQCPVCANCRVICGNEYGWGKEVVFNDILEDFRADLVDLGIGPAPEQKKFGESVRKSYNPYWEPHEDRMKWMPSSVKPSKKAKIAYFVGCTSSYRMKETAQATVKVLDAAGVDFMMLDPEEWCCGSPLFRTGQRELAKEMMKHNVDAVKASGAKSVIFSCAGCYRTFKVDYQDYLGPLPFKLMHTTDLVAQLLKKKKLKLKKFPGTVTYHDPCHMGRHLYIGNPPDPSVFEPPRQVLKAIPGLKFREMERTKEMAWCCGAGGGTKSAYNDFAISTAIERIKEAEETGAKALISSCPFCRRNLIEAIEKSGSKIKMYDIMELLANVIA